MSLREVVDELLRGQPRRPGACGRGTADVNIALVKYWGKRDPALNLPVTDSLSVGLPGLGTETVIRPAERDRFELDEQVLAPDGPFARRLAGYLDLFRCAEAPAFAVQTHNSVPTAAGLASSASGYAALVRALVQLFGWELDDRQLSILARLGSGSAARSLAEGFVHWHAGSREDGMDSFAEALPARWPGLQVGVLSVSEAVKAESSRAGMARCQATSALYTAWPSRVGTDLERLRAAIHARDLRALGETAEQNAMSMHAVMLGAWPPLCYWQPRTLAHLQTLWRARAEGLPAYATLDAGANVKLLYEADCAAGVRQTFPELRAYEAFAAEE